MPDVARQILESAIEHGNVNPMAKAELEELLAARINRGPLFMPVR